MSAYAPLVASHVIVAVVGIGLLGAVPLVARAARRAALTVPASAALLEPLLRATRWSLAVMALTGILLDVAVRGAFHSGGWFRASFALLVFVGFAHARARAGLRKAPAPAADAAAALRRVERWGWAMCATVALIAALMEVKPF